ncbi:MAG: ABC transporter ATP-binding protein [Deltaproteobacteria bacterium]|nr:ABC transporter ATP-binding protein [Deltaproteobacteria bacterium]
MGEQRVVIRADRLFKSYGDNVAVNRIGFQVRSGEVFGIVGPNGAGKTTIVNMITGKCTIGAGDLSVFDRDVKGHDREIRRIMGVVSQDDSLDPDLSVYENLVIYSSYFGTVSRSKIDELLTFFELKEYVDYNVMSLSGGMRRRLSLARGLVNDPLLLVLDEPTTGLDPQARLHTWDKLLQIKEQGITILITTHYMEEVTRLCDRVMIMHDGTIIAVDTPASIIASHYPTDVIELKINNGQEFTTMLAALGDFKFTYELTSKFGLIIPSKFEDVRAIQKRLIELYPNAYPVRRVPNLEDAFLAITGVSLQEGE